MVLSGSAINAAARPTSRWRIFLAAGAIVVATLAAYSNSFSGPFIYDDGGSITQNPTIRHLWPMGSVLSPPIIQAVGGRPLLNLSLALNYALSGYGVWSYHALNLLIHVCAGLALFGLVRRTLLEHPTSNFQCPTSKSIPPPTSKSNGSISPQSAFGNDATPLAFTVALLWAVHPLQTESVTYIIQRGESLMGLFYLLTLYCFVRGTEGTRDEAGGGRPDRPHTSHLRPPASVFWLLSSIISCLLGMATKEVMVSAPLMVLLYDRTFVAGTFRDAWRKRWRYYVGLAGTWLLLVDLVVITHGRGGTASFNGRISVWVYALTQFRAIVHYLCLSVWPRPLVLDYGRAVVRQIAVAAPYALVIVTLAALTVAGLWRNHPLGFLGAWFFAILAPSSSVLPQLTETIAEHRMYLPLAAVIVLVALVLHSLLGRRSLMVCLALSAGLGVLTVRRNQDYRSELAIWNDNVAKCPDNPWPHYDLGNALCDVPGRLPDAIAQYETALRLDPAMVESHVNLGNIFLKMPGRLPDAIAQFEAALRINPDLSEAHNNLGNALFNLPGRLPDAIAHYEAALQINPNSVNVHYNLANALLKMPRRLPDAIAQLKAALQLKPDLKPAQDMLNRLQPPNEPGANAER